MSTVLRTARPLYMGALMVGTLKELTCSFKSDGELAVLSDEVIKSKGITTTEISFETVVPSACLALDLFQHTPQRVDMEFSFPADLTPTCYQPLSRVTRSGRRVYGGAPALGPHLYTAGGKLERRRVRSRLAALVRRLPPQPCTSFRVTDAVVKSDGLVVSDGAARATLTIEGRRT